MNEREPKDVRREHWGGHRMAWGVTVVWGNRDNYPTNSRRQYYATRAQARAADISDAVGQRGRLA